MSQYYYTVALSLFDSLTTAQQIVIFALLLSTAKPIRNSMAFLAGLSCSYFACGIAGYLAIDRLNSFLNKYFPSISNTSYYQFEFITGIALVLFGIWYYRSNKNKGVGYAENLLFLRLKSMSSLFAFCIGAFISISTFPFSIPYIVALEKFATLHLSVSKAIGSILLYNIGYVFPMLVVFAFYIYIRNRANNLNVKIQEHTRLLNIHLTTWTSIGVGVFTIIDSGLYFTLGHALLKGRFF